MILLCQNLSGMYITYCICSGSGNLSLIYYSASFSSNGYMNERVKHGLPSENHNFNQFLKKTCEENEDFYTLEMFGQSFLCNLLEHIRILGMMRDFNNYSV